MKKVLISILVFTFLLCCMSMLVHAEEHSVEYDGATYTYSDAGVLVSAENAIGAVDLAVMAKANNITLKSIGKDAFHYGDNAITSVNIPASVQIIGEYAFYDCGNLSTVTYEEGSKLISVGFCAFALDYSLSCFCQNGLNEAGIYDFPEGLTTIAGYAFESTVPQNVILHEKCSNVGESAFESASTFSVTIYNNNIIIGDGAFPNTTIIYANPESTAAKYAGDNGITCQLIADDSEDGGDESGNGNNGNEQSSSDEEGKTTETNENDNGENSGDTNGKNDKNTVKPDTDNAGDNKTSGGSNVDTNKTNSDDNFDGTKTSGSEKTGEKGAESDRKSTAVNIEKGKQYTVNGLIYKAISNSAVVLVKPKKKSITKLKVPDKVKINSISYPVTAVSAKACYKFAKLKTVTIGNNVSVVGKQAFMGCKKLKSVTFGKGLTKLEAKCFANDKKLKKVIIKSKKLKKVGKNCMKGTTSKQYMIPKGYAKKYSKLFSRAK